MLLHRNQLTDTSKTCAARSTDSHPKAAVVHIHASTWFLLSAIAWTRLKLARNQTPESHARAQGLCRSDHVLERGDHFIPRTRLQAAIRIDPQPLCRNTLSRFAHQLHNVLLARNIRRVDVVHARSNLVRVVEVIEGIE